MNATTSNAASASTTASGDRATDHTIRYDTWVSYNSTWKYFKVTLARAHALMHSYTHALALASRFADVDGLDWRLVRDGRGQN